MKTYIITFVLLSILAYMIGFTYSLNNTNDPHKYVISYETYGCSGHLTYIVNGLFEADDFTDEVSTYSGEANTCKVGAKGGVTITNIFKVY